MSKERVDIRIEPELLEELEILAQRSGFKRSEIIREAIANYVDEQKHGWNSSILNIQIPNRLADRVDWAILNGDAGTVDSVVEKSLEHWLEFRENWHLEKKERLNQMAAENARNDTAKTQLEVNAKQLARK